MNDCDARHPILLATDPVADRSPAGEILVAAGFAVEVAAAGQPAVAAAAAGRYALMLLDLGQPAADGVETTRQIRRLPYPWGGVPILALAAVVAVADRDRCFAAGMDGFLPLASDRPQWLAAVAHWLEAGDDPTWGLDPYPGVSPPLVNRRTLAQLEEDVGPEMLPEVLTTFLLEAERRLDLLAAQVAAGDTRGAALEAHALKGSSGTFGAMALHQAVQEMERCGRAGDGACLAVLLPEVRHLIVASCDLLRAEYSLAATDSLTPPSRCG